jgi:hypothetical protein
MGKKCLKYLNKFLFPSRLDRVARCYCLQSDVIILRMLYFLILLSLLILTFIFHKSTNALNPSLDLSIWLLYLNALLYPLQIYCGLSQKKTVKKSKGPYLESTGSSFTDTKDTSQNQALLLSSYNFQFKYKTKNSIWKPCLILYHIVLLSNAMLCISYWSFYSNLQSSLQVFPLLLYGFNHSLPLCLCLFDFVYNGILMAWSMLAFVYVFGALYAVGVVLGKVRNLFCYGVWEESAIFVFSYMIIVVFGILVLFCAFFVIAKIKQKKFSHSHLQKVLDDI